VPHCAVPGGRVGVMRSGNDLGHERGICSREEATDDPDQNDHSINWCSSIVVQYAASFQSEEKEHGRHDNVTEGKEQNDPFSVERIRNVSGEKRYDNEWNRLSQSNHP